jgi:hypothetical protein
MNEAATYLLRLTGVCLGAFFVIHLFVTLIVVAVSSTAMSFSNRLRPATGARLIFFLRVLPMAFSFCFVLAFCIPSYVRFEHDATESIGSSCLLLALSGFILFSLSFARFLRAIVLSNQFMKDPSTNPGFALVGILHPRIFISSNIERALTTSQMEVAIRHEKAHRSAHDNLKRLFIIASPSLLLFAEASRKLEAQWAKLAEWAADESAVANEPCRAIDLADALLRVARISSCVQAIPAASSLVASQEDLAYRITRLLNLSPKDSLHPNTLRVQTFALTALITACVLPFSPGVQYAVHSIMERLVH